MRNYIEFFYDEDDYLTAQIHSNGRIRTITNPERLDKLISICEKRGYKIKGEKIIRRSADRITKDYNNHIKRIKRLQILGEITENMRISLKNPALGKTITAILLAGTISATGIGLIKSTEKHEEAPSKEYYATYVEPQIEEGAKVISENAIYLENEDIDFLINELEQSENQNTEINEMFQEDAFHFSYENRVNNGAYQNAMRYEDLFEKYANMYGLDKNLLIAVASQESSGDHYSNLEGGPAIGIMQVEKAPNIGQTIEVYNFELGHKESIEITEEKLKDLEQNIKIGAMLLRHSIVYNNYNISIGVQNYNMGFGNMGKILETCSEKESTTIDELKDSPTNNTWLQYRTICEAGDTEYLEHVFSYIPEGEPIKIKDTENNTYTLQIQNDYINTLEKTNI